MGRKPKKKERRITIVARRRDWDSERFAQALASYVLSELQADQKPEATDEGSA